MKVALVALPNPVLAVPVAHFPQSLLYVASSLMRSGHQVQVVDLRARRYITEADIPEVDCVGVTSTSGEIEWARTVARLARAKGIKTMLGGAHATFVPEDCYEDFDYVVAGDGEQAAPAVLTHIAGLVHPSQIAASIWPPLYNFPLNDLAGWFPFPGWSLIGEKGLSRELFTGAGYGQGPLAAGIISSRGCGFHCAYCRAERDRIRLRPISDVVGEIQTLQESYGVKHFRFYDENFSNPKPRALELYKALEPLGIKIRAHTRSDAIDDELAEAAKRAGVEEMGFGFESADDRVLQAIRKQETMEDHCRAVRVAKKAGLVVKAFWMTGLPSESWASIKAIKRFMAEERPDKWIVSKFAPYPGSDVWAHPERYAVTWMEKDLSKYWNFADSSLIEYVECNRRELDAHYQDLTAWLGKEFPR